jgi:hypothetical protein
MNKTLGVKFRSRWEKVISRTSAEDWGCPVDSMIDGSGGNYVVEE